MILSLIHILYDDNYVWIESVNVFAKIKLACQNEGISFDLSRQELYQKLESEMCIRDRYSAFKRAVSLGNTLLWLFNRRSTLLRLSIAFVVYITFRCV